MFIGYEHNRQTHKKSRRRYSSEGVPPQGPQGDQVLREVAHIANEEIRSVLLTLAQA